MKRFFKRNECNPDTRKIYAVVTGDYVGEMFIYIGEKDEEYLFLSVPKNINRYIPKEKFDFAWNSGIIEFVEKAPRQIYKVAEKQFYYNENSNNRREQFDSSHFLDSEESIEEDKY